VSVWRKYVVLLAVALGAAACTEKLGTGRACPALCPIEEVGIVDTTIQGVATDTTVYPGPPIGSEPSVLLLTRTDGALDLRGVFRFDTLPTTFRKKKPTAEATADTTPYEIKALKNAQLIVSGDTTASAPPLPADSVTIVAYDVDTAGVADTAVAPVAALFTPSREIGRKRLRAEAVRDTFAIPLNDAVVLAKLQAGKHLRVGLRIESGGNTAIRLNSTNSAVFTTLRFAPSATADTAQADSLQSFLVNSRTPTDDPAQRGYLIDYTLVVKGNPPPAPGELAVGGMRGRRIYMTFDIPKRLLDSTQVVRATLRLNQVRSPVAAASDTAQLRILLGTSLASVTDITKRALFHEPFSFDPELGLYFGVTSGLRGVKLKADSSGVRAIELAPILRQWAGTDVTKQPHAIILSLPTEGVSPVELRFSSLEAAAALRPTLQITYVPRNAPGIP
jgi:hypothetical protein